MMDISFSSIIERLNSMEISDVRKSGLREIASVIESELNTSNQVNLNFICTHNSRRSQFSQVWSHFLCEYYEIKNIRSFSGGTETTTVFSEVLRSLERTGFSVYSNNEEENPHYQIKWNKDGTILELFSKRYDDPTTLSPVIALMTCSDADRNCPIIPTAKYRIPLTYKDPKISDGKDDQQEHYDRRSFQIASELNFLYKTLRIK